LLIKRYKTLEINHCDRKKMIKR